jgi:hypothetical protein
MLGWRGVATDPELNEDDMVITRGLIEERHWKGAASAAAERPGVECRILSVIEWLTDLSCGRRTPLRNLFMLMRSMIIV